MNARLTEMLKEKHQYEDWRGQTSLAEGLLLWRYFLIGDELAGLELVNSQRVEPPGWPTSIQSIWRAPTEHAGALVRLDLFECGSLEVAHEFVIRFLAEFQSPLIGREPEAPVGDVTFAGPDDAVIVFARGNMVVGLRNAGSEIVTVRPLAAALDAELSNRPRPGGAVVPEIRRFGPDEREFRPDTGGPLALDASDPLQRPLRFKFFSTGADLLLEEGRPLLRPAAPGSGRVTLVVENANRGVASQTFDLAGGPDATREVRPG
jgi:hypothetical protein